VEASLRTFNKYSLSQSLVLVIALGGVFYQSSVLASNFTQGGNARMMVQSNKATGFAETKTLKKIKRFNIDFTKNKTATASSLSTKKDKLSVESSDQKNAGNSDINENIAEAEADLKNAGAVGQKRSLISSNVEPSSSTSSLKVAAPEESKAFSVTLMVAKSREVELPESGQYSNETTYIFLPSYKISDNYTTGLKLIGVHDANNTEKSDLKTGSASLIRSSIDVSDYFTTSPGIVYGFPVNSKQRDTDSFLGSAQANVNFSTKKDVLGDLSLSTIFGATKSFYQYTTQLNLDPSADDTYNSDYSFFEIFQAQHPIIGDLSFSFSLTNKQAWDFAGEKKYSYDMTETLNWQVSKVFTLFGGLENEEAVKASESDLNYRFFNSETSTYVLGLSIGI
jgi:hypothetical protein